MLVRVRWRCQTFIFAGFICMLMAFLNPASGAPQVPLPTSSFTRQASSNNQQGYSPNPPGSFFVVQADDDDNDHLLSRPRTTGSNVNHGLASSAATTGSQIRPTFSILREGFGNEGANRRTGVSLKSSTSAQPAQGHFGTIPRFRIEADDDLLDGFTNEEFDLNGNSKERISLGRRYHPQGIPRISNPYPVSTSTQYMGKSTIPQPTIVNPFIVTSDTALFFKDDSPEFDDDDDDNVVFVPLSPMVKAFNPSQHNERLSLSQDFMSQYNFVDVQGSSQWGYKTKDQYQDHTRKSDGAMEGKFGWVAPGGSKVNVKYIADKGGYRVVSSTGLFTKESDEVLAARESHFSEHQKARDRIASYRAEKTKGTFGVPLPNLKFDASSKPSTDFTGFPEPILVPHSGGVVTLPAQENFPLLQEKPSSVGVGIPLPTFNNGVDSTGTSFQPVDATQTDSVGQNGKITPVSNDQFGIPLVDATASSPDQVIPQHTMIGSDPTFQVGFDDNTIKTSVPASPSFGIPIPSLTDSSPSNTFQPSDQTSFDVGTTFDAGTSIQPTTTGVGFGVPIPSPADSVAPSSSGLPSDQSGLGFDTTFDTGSSSQPSSNGGGFGIPIPSTVDSAVSISSGLPSGQAEFGLDKNIDPSVQPSLSGEGFGIPIPSLTDTTVSEGVGFDASVDTSASFQPALNEGEFGTSIPSHTDIPSQTGSASSGSSVVPSDQSGLGLDTTFDTSFSSQPTSNGGSFGVPLPSPTDSTSFSSPAIPSDKTGFGLDQNIDASVQPSSNGEGFGIPIPSPTDSAAPDTTGLSPDQSGLGLDATFDNSGSAQQSPAGEFGTLVPLNTDSVAPILSDSSSDQTGFGFDSTSDASFSSQPSSNAAAGFEISASSNTDSASPSDQSGFGLDSTFDSTVSQSNGFDRTHSAPPNDNTGFGLDTGFSSASDNQETQANAGTNLIQNDFGTEQDTSIIEKNQNGNSFDQQTNDQEGFGLTSQGGAIFSTNGHSKITDSTLSSTSLDSNNQNGAPLNSESSVSSQSNGASSPSAESHPSNLFTGILEDTFSSSATGVGESSPGTEEMTSGNKNSQDPNFNSFPSTSSDIGISLFDINASLNTNTDLLQGPPFEENPSSANKQKEQFFELGPPKNSLGGPKFNPAVSFKKDSGVFVTGMDKSNSANFPESQNADGAIEDKFIVVVNSDIFPLV